MMGRQAIAQDQAKRPHGLPVPSELPNDLRFGPRRRVRTTLLRRRDLRVCVGCDRLLGNVR